jgi:hypothetical protein
MWGMQTNTSKKISFPGYYLHFYLFFFFFGKTGVWTQGFAFAKQALYPLSYSSSPFCSSYFGDAVGGVSHKLFAWAGFELWSSWSQPPK